MNKNIFILVFVAILLASNVNAIGAQVETLSPHWLAAESAVLKGNITSLALEENATAFFQYRQSHVIEWTNSSQSEFMNESGEYMLNIFYLTPNINYTYRAMLITPLSGLITGLNEVNFTTYKAPIIILNSTFNIDNESLSVIIDVLDLGNESIVPIYLDCCYWTGVTDFCTNTTQTNVEFIGPLTIGITGLQSGREYYCIGVAEFNIGATYPYVFYTMSNGVIVNTLANENELVGYETGITGVQTAVFVGFGLIAVGLLVAIAFLFIKMFNDGFDVASLTAVSIMAIGLAIVLVIGYMIINAVANGLI